MGAADPRGRQQYQRRRQQRRSGDIAGTAGRDPALRGGLQRGARRLCGPGGRQEADAVGHPWPAAGPGPAQHLFRQGRCRSLRRAGHRCLRRHRRGAAAAARQQQPEGDLADRRHPGYQGRHPGRRPDHRHRRQADQRHRSDRTAARQGGQQGGPHPGARGQAQAVRCHRDPPDHPRDQRAQPHAGTGLRVHPPEHVPGRHRRRFPETRGPVAAAGWRQAQGPGAGSAQQPRRPAHRSGAGGR